MLKIWKPFTCMGLCFLCFLLCGCPVEETISICGYVHFAGPVAGATVDVLSDGQVAHQETNETSELGTFMLEIPKNRVRESFRLEAHIGSVDGEAFAHVLRADIDGFDPEEHTFIDINTVTTLVAAYRDAHTDVALADCIEEVKAFLEIPAEVDIYTDLVGWDSYFDSTILVAELQQLGWDLDDFMDALVAEMDSGDGTRTFVTWDEPVKISGAAAMTIGQTLIQKANDQFGGPVLGWACSVFGSDDYKTQQQLTIIRGMLDDIKNQLTEISGQLHDISASILDLSLEIKQSTQVLLTAGEQQSYNTISGLIANDVVAIEKCMESYRWIVDHCSTASKEDMDTRVSALIAAIEKRDIASAVSHIDMVLRGAIPSSQGMYALIDDVLFDKSYATKHFDQLNQFYEYWAQVQLNGLLLLAEYNHVKYPLEPLDPAGPAKGPVGSYKEALTAQSDLYLSAVERQLGFYSTPTETRAAALTYGVMRVQDSAPNAGAYLADCEPLRGAEYRVASVLPRSRVLSFHFYAGPYWGSWEVGAGLPPLRQHMTKLAVIDILKNKIYPSTAVMPPYTTYQYSYKIYDMASWMTQTTDKPYRKFNEFVRCEFFDLPPGAYQLVVSDFENVYAPFGATPLYSGAPLVGATFQVSDMDPVHSYIMHLLP